jgi:hypothetical protein
MGHRLVTYSRKFALMGRSPPQAPPLSEPLLWFHLENITTNDLGAAVEVARAQRSPTLAQR